MAAIVKDIVIEQGSVFKWIWLETTDGVTPVDLSDHTAKMQIRASYADSDVGDPIIELEDSAGITLGEDGTVSVLITPEQTESFSFSDAFYDIELTPLDGNTERVYQGRVRLNREVTR